MQIKGVSWVGVRHEKVEEVKEFYEKKLGLTKALEEREKDFAIFVMSDSTFFETLGPGNRLWDYAEEPLVAFKVESVAEARKELEGRGVKFISETMENTGIEWAVFEGPGGYNFMIQSSPGF